MENKIILIIIKKINFLALVKQCVQNFWRYLVILNRRFLLLIFLIFRSVLRAKLLYELGCPELTCSYKLLLFRLKNQQQCFLHEISIQTFLLVFDASFTITVFRYTSSLLIRTETVLHYHRVALYIYIYRYIVFIY